MNQKEEIRMNLWADVIKNSALTSSSVSVNTAINWANRAVEEFDKKFNQA